ncbi:MAG: NAD(+)/NADH kinase [Acidimicrobiia bacterium]
MSTVGIVLHTERPLARTLAREAREWLIANGHEVRFPANDAALVGVSEAWDETKFGHGLNLILSMGGDGTMLRALRLISPHDVDILGINVGRLGYLTEVEPAGMVEALERYFQGDYKIDERMLLSVSSPEVAELALNEAVVEKTASGHTIRLGVYVNGDFFTNYITDGLIVATPTGSTAYSLSARGPIVDPSHQALILTPVAPHMLFDRSLVLNPNTEIIIEVGDGRPASLSVDGRSVGVFEQGHRIYFRTSPHRARLVNFGLREFHAILKDKFGLNER